MILKTVKDYLKNTDNLSDISKRLAKHNCTSRREFDEVFSNKRFVDVLINDYRKYDNLIVAFDFDDTVQPSDIKKPSCDLVIELLQICSALGFTMICFTARTLNSDIEEVRETCKRLHINCDYINEDADVIRADQRFEHSKKIFYNIFLDDRAGLRSAYEILWEFIEWFLNQDINNIDARKEGY